MRGRGVVKLLAAAVLALLGAGAWIYATRWAPSRDWFPDQGIAITADAGDVQWPTAHAAGVDFAYLRATAGAMGRDERFAGYWEATRKAGVKRGAWHGYSLCQSADAQANNFVAAVPREKTALPAAILLDFTADCPARPGKERVVEEVRLLLQVIEQQTGKRALLWVSERFDDAYGISAGYDRDLWLIGSFFRPNYGGRPWRMWQSSTIRRVNGVAGPARWAVIYPRAGDKGASSAL